MTEIECKSFNNTPAMNNQIQTKKNKQEKKENSQNISTFNKINQKLISGTNISIINKNMNKGSNRNTTISLSSKLSDISEKLEKYENLVNKLGKEI